MRPPRLLLLTSTLGSGHLRAAQAVETAVRAACPQAQIQTLDFWSLLDAGVARAVRQAYLQLVQEQPDLYERIYRLDERTLRRTLDHRQPLPPELAEGLRFIASIGLGRSLPPAEGDRQAPVDRLAFRLLCLGLRNGARVGGALRARIGRRLIDSGRVLLAQRLRARLHVFDPDVVVATQMHPASLLSFAKRRYRIEVPLVAVVTDYGLHDFWRQPEIDHTCVAHESIAAACAAELGPQRITDTGMPLMPGFRAPPTQSQARAELGLDDDRPIALVLGGGLGLGVPGVAERLLAGVPEARVLVVAGHNGPALAQLAQLAQAQPQRLRAYEWTDRMQDLIAAADVVIGKPGGLTTAEALACGRPLLATHSVGGQEGFNLRFLEAQAVGRRVTDDRLPAAVAALFAAPDELRRCQDRARAVGRRDGAARIAAIALELARRRARPAPERFAWLRPTAQRALRAVDALYHARHRLLAVGEVLYVGRTRYRGPALDFADGTRIGDGDWIGTLHFNNERFLRIDANDSRRAALRFARLMLDSLHRLAERAACDPALADLPAFHGLSWLGEHGQGVGFVTEPIAPGWRCSLRAAYFRLLVWSYAPAAQTRAAAAQPTQYWLTRTQLLNRFGAARAARSIEREAA